MIIGIYNSEIFRIPYKYRNGKLFYFLHFLYQQVVGLFSINSLPTAISCRSLSDDQKKNLSKGPGLEDFLTDNASPSPYAGEQGMKKIKGERFADPVVCLLSSLFPQCS